LSITDESQDIYRLFSGPDHLVHILLKRNVVSSPFNRLATDNNLYCVVNLICLKRYGKNGDRDIK